jgi:phosphohistidine swiveling domain-containing protein
MTPATPVPARPLAAPRLLDADAARTHGPSLIGGKAASLVTLQDADLPVPPFMCVTTTVFDDVVAAMPRDLRDELRQPPSDYAKLQELSERAKAHVERSAIAPDLQRLADLLVRDFGADALFAVRSSSVGEDSATHSFAGQFATFLGVEGDRVADRVLDCFASAFSSNALAYRHARGVEFDAARIAVVIQLMVDSAAAGVAFTADPSSGRTDRILITAGLGLGEGVVDGSVATDTYVLDQACSILERTVALKRARVARDPDHASGTRLIDVPEAEGARPALSDRQVIAVAACARACACTHAHAQDVEWAIDRDGAVWVLQARPITTLQTGRQTVFDSSNLVESYPGLTAPLTFSLMRRAYEVNFLGLVRAFGAPRAMVAANRDVYANLVGLLDGRMYYNLSNWYRMFTQLPGLERALPAFEQAMGFTPEAVVPRRLSLAARLRWLPLQTLFVIRLIVAWVTVPRRVRAFQGTLAQETRQLADRGVQTLEAHELVDGLERASERLFERMSVAPISDFFTQQVYGLLGQLIERWRLGDPVALRNELLCGETGMESVEPVRSLVGLAERVRADAVAEETVASDRPPREIWARVEHDPALAWLRRGLAVHLQRYGDRALNELKLEGNTLLDDPSVLVAMLRNYIRGGQDVESMEAHEQGIRRSAEQAVRAKLRYRPVRSALFAAVLGRCRAGLKTRESVRLTRGRMAGFFRGICRALGEQLMAVGLLDRREDVFFLTVAEVGDAVRGASVTSDLRQLVALRRSDYARNASGAAPSRVEVRGIAHGTTMEPPVPQSSADAGELRGTGCSPGRVRARAMVIGAPAADLTINGEILVASTTDPGWVFLMVAAGGLISEQGNVLSHTAIIGRELGIPTIVGVPNAMRLIPDGTTIELDGRAGTITIDPDPEA